MIHVRSRIAVFTLSLALVIVACEKDATTPTDPVNAGPAVPLAKFSGSKTYPVSVFATDLNNPRGLKFGTDGYLYVAEAGLGGMISTRGQCDSVVAPIGPYTGGMTGRISRISHSGERSTVADNLPSSQTSAASGSLVSGVADVEFIGHQLYAILAGAGCSHGVSGVPNAVIKVKGNGTWSVVADLSAFQMTHHVANPDPDDFEPDGTWYSMIRVEDDLFAVEPNHQEIDRISPTSGSIHRLVDFSAYGGTSWIGPTAMVYHSRSFYVGNLAPFPIVEGSSSVYRVSRNGQINVWAKGFTTILGLEFDKKGRLYVLENTTGNPFPTPGTGTILRINKSGTRDTIATHLFLPTALTIGPDRNLYVSNKGFGPPIPGFGEVLKIDLHDSADRDDEDDD